MKGITPVIAIILLLLITISMVGFAFVWFSRMAVGITNQTEEQIQQQIAAAAKKVAIDSVTAGNIWVRNIGAASIPVGEISVYVNNAKVTCTWTGSIAPGAVSACGVGCAAGGKARATAPGNYDERGC
jgi:flagellin-like protein